MSFPHDRDLIRLSSIKRILPGANLDYQDGDVIVVDELFNQEPRPLLRQDSVSLNSPVSLSTSGTWYDIVSLTIDVPGKHLICSRALLEAKGTSNYYVFRVTDGTIHYAATEISSDGGILPVTIPCAIVTVPKNGATIRLQGVCSVTNVPPPQILVSPAHYSGGLSGLVTGLSSLCIRSA